MNLGHAEFEGLAGQLNGYNKHVEIQREISWGYNFGSYKIGIYKSVFEP